MGNRKNETVVSCELVCSFRTPHFTLILYLYVVVAKFYVRFVYHVIEIAMSHNDNNVTVYKKQANKWVQTGELTDHGQRVTGIDWAPKSNVLVTCGAVS